MKKIDPVTGLEVKSDTRIYNDGPCFTQQSAKSECDINVIVESAKRGADLSQHIRPGTPMYGDFTGLPDYRESMLLITKAREMFMTLDPFVRERFSNDPGRLLEFLGDAKNRDEAVKLGLIKPPEAPKVDEHLETLKSIDKGLKGHSKKTSEKSDD